MRNFKIHLDLIDLLYHIKALDLTEFNQCFMIYFVEADNPDCALYTLLYRIKYLIMDSSEDIEYRIVCRKLKSLIRIDRIESL